MTAPADLHHVLDPAALRAARRRAGLALADVEPRVGRAASIVARYERGRIDPPASVLGALAGLYGVHPGEFFHVPAGRPGGDVAHNPGT